MNIPLLIAHRGESRDAPENTLGSVRLAWERGAPAVEIDARLSADGVAVVIHDATTRRIGGPAEAVGRQTAAQLAAIDAGAWKHRRWRGERIPLLRDVLRSVPAGRRLFLELKEGPESVRAVADVRKATRLPFEQLTVMSFRRATVEALSREFPKAEVCYLLERRDWERPGGLERAIRFARTHRLDALNLEASRKLNPGVIKRIHEDGLAVYCWTVNRTATARRLFRAGIDGVTTDRCGLMRVRLGMEFPSLVAAPFYRQKFRETS